MTLICTCYVVVVQYGRCCRAVSCVVTLWTYLSHCWGVFVLCGCSCHTLDVVVVQIGQCFVISICGRRADSDSDCIIIIIIIIVSILLLFLLLLLLLFLLLLLLLLQGPY